MGNFVSAGPGEAVLISGVRGTRVRVGTTSFRFWVLDRVDRLSLELLQLQLHTIEAETVQGVRVTVTAIANVKVSARVVDQAGDSADAPQRLDRKKILLASQHFLGKTQSQIREQLQQTLEGHQRQIVSSMTVEQIFKDRAAFSAKVREHVHEDMEFMGIQVVSYNITEISDENGYLKSLGASQIAKVKREAAIGEATNQSEARQKVAQAESVAAIQSSLAIREAHVAQAEQNQLEASADRELELKRAENLARVNEAKERAEAASKITQAQQEQEVVKERMRQKFVEKEVQTKIAEQEALRMQVEVEGAGRAKLAAQEADSKAVLIKANAEAQRIRLIAEAEAHATRSRGEAEAHNLRLQAEAYNQFGESALAYMLINKLPEIAQQIAAPLSKTDKITFVSSGNGEGGTPSALTRDMTAILGQLPVAVQALTGFDLREAVSNSGNRNTRFSIAEASGKAAPIPIVANLTAGHGKGKRASSFAVASEEAHML